jgi:hypothetical protein
MNKLTQALAIALLLFFVILAVLIGTRIDQYTIAVLAGATVGLVIATPCTALVTYLVARSNRVDASRETSWRYGPPPAWPMAPTRFDSAARPSRLARQPLDSSADAFELPPRRRFYLIGEGGQATEIEPEQVDDYLT